MQENSICFCMQNLLLQDKREASPGHHRVTSVAHKAVTPSSVVQLLTSAEPKQLTSCVLAKT